MLRTRTNTTWPGSAGGGHGLTGSRGLRSSPSWPPWARTARSPKELILSEKTVARHVGNIFTKLGVSSVRRPRRTRMSTIWSDIERRLLGRITHIGRDRPESHTSRPMHSRRHRRSRTVEPTTERRLRCPQTQIAQRADHAGPRAQAARRHVDHRTADRRRGDLDGAARSRCRTRHGPAARPGRVRRRLVRGDRGACRDGTTSSPRTCPATGSRRPMATSTPSGVIAWLDDVIAATCARPSGRWSAGFSAGPSPCATPSTTAIGVGRLVLVDTLGLSAVRAGAAVRGSAPALSRRPDGADPRPTDAVLRPRLRRRAEAAR